MIDLTPDEFRQLGYRAIDLIADRMAQVRDLPVRQPVPADVREALMHAPLPEVGQEAEAVLQQVADQVLAYPMGNSSPRFVAWINSPPAPMGVLADLLAAAHGASVAGGDQSAVYLEHGVLNWIKAIMHFPASSGALLTSGGSIANLIPLAVMRHVKTQGRVRAEGLHANPKPMVVYTSTQGHSCIQKAVELLGFGNDFLYRVPVDADYRMDVGALLEQIQRDRELGFEPVCVVASAGTVNVGSIDPLDQIADICEAEDLWLHIDGAYGAVGILADEVAPLYAGIERADSLAVDPHKWMYMPVECGCTLVRDAQAMRDAFSVIPPYLRDDNALPWFSEFGVQQTRGFKALKLWMTIQHIGIDGYRQLISRDIEMARTLRAKIQARPDFELMSNGPLSATCFRYAPAGVDDLDTVNKRLVAVVQQSGETFLTSTELDGRIVLRTCIVNFRTTPADLDRVLNAVAAAGQSLLSQPEAG